MKPRPEGKDHASLTNVVLTVVRSLQTTDHLFDFETCISEDIFVTNGPALVFRKRDEGQGMGRTRVVVKRQAINGQMPGYDFEPVVEISVKRKMDAMEYLLAPSFVPYPENLQNLKGLPFICLTRHGKTSEKSMHRIDKGDVIKLGKTMFRVVETHLTRKKSSQQSFLEVKDGEFSTVANSEGISCRICLSEGGEDLIAPCLCRGSCQYVHFSCLQTWIKSKVRKQENRLVSIYSLSKLQCELCKHPLPNKMQISTKKHFLVEFSWPVQPFLLLEQLHSHSLPSKTFMILTPKEREVRIGRWPGMDLRLPDITISRIHSCIGFTQGHFWIRDEGSKFGTLILLQKAVEVGRGVWVQAGSKVYKLQQHRPRLWRA